MTTQSAEAVDMEFVKDLVFNAITTRSRFVESLMDRRRDIDNECGFLKTIYIEHYRKYYDRHPIANRVVGVMPLESWQVLPEVYEDDDASVTTEFEQAWQDLPKSLRGRSWAKTKEEGNPVWEVLKRADVISGIGRFGLILIGIDDGQPLDVPAVGVDTESPTGNAEPTGRRKLTYLRALDESCVSVSEFETNQSSPRFGQPTYYSVTINDNDQSYSHGNAGATIPQGNYRIHWTRVVHIADNIVANEQFGAPRQEAVFNHLMTLEKLYGGSGEMYWQGAFPGYSVETHPQLGGDVQIDKAAVRAQFEQLMNGLQRYSAISGAAIKLLSPTVVDPTPQIKVQIDAICIKLGIPVRIFVGSERGELASSQDDSAWNDRLRERENGYITPRIIIPFVDRLILMGVLPEPTDGYYVDWPDLESLSDADKASIAAQRTQALASYVTSGANSMIDPVDFLSRILGFSESDAQAMIDRTMERVEEEDTGTSPLLSMVGGLTGVVSLFQAYKDGSLTRENLSQTLQVFFGMDEERAEQFIADNSPSPTVDPLMSDPAMMDSPMDGGEADANPFPPPMANVENKSAPSKGLNCGIGAGGFKPGNRCAAGGNGGDKGKFIGQKVGRPEQEYSASITVNLAKALGGKTEKHVTSPGQVDKKPFDVRVDRPGGKGTHDIEVKTMLKGGKTSISVHDDALLRKVEHVEKTKGSVFHTVVVDHRDRYAGGIYAEKHSGHDIYYKRGSGRYSLSKMHKVKSMAELKSLLETPDKKLPEAARGKLPPPPPKPVLEKKAAAAKESRNKKDKKLKAAKKDILKAQARERYIAKKKEGFNG